MAGWSGLEPNFLAFMINFNFLFVNYVDLATRYDIRRQSDPQRNA